MITIDILYLVDRLEALINKSSVVPLTTKRLIEEDEFLDILDQMRVAIPEEIKNSRRVMQDKERMLAQAKEEGERVIALARDQASQMTSDHGIVLNAQDRAAQIQQEAEAEARAVRAGADEYAFEVLTDLQARLDEFAARIAQLQGQIYNGLRVVNDKRGAPQSPPPPHRVHPNSPE